MAKAKCITLVTIERTGRKPRVLVSAPMSKSAAKTRCKKMQDMGLRCHVVCGRS